MACMSAVGGLNIASDLSILVIPMFGIGRLQMPLKKKLLASSVFAFGILYVEPFSPSTTSGNIDNFKAPQLPPPYAFITAFNWPTLKTIPGLSCRLETGRKSHCPCSQPMQR